MDPGFPILNNLPLWYEVLPLCFLALVQAATRRPRGPSAFEVVAAALWFVTLLGLGLWHPMFSNVETLGSGVLDGLAIVAGLTAVSMIVLGVRMVVSVRARPASAVACSLEVLGLGALGLHLSQISFTLWAAMRLYPTGGINGVFDAARRNAAIVGLVAILLVAGTIAERGADRVRAP